MSTIETTSQALPTGTWNADPVHSHVGFAVEYVGGTFRGTFSPFDATLAVTEDGVTLTGSAPVAGVKVQDDNLTAHLQSPDFFDAERAPEIAGDRADVGALAALGLEHGPVAIRLIYKAQTVNLDRAGGQFHDLAVAGAQPLALTLSLVLEEGLSAEELRAEVEAIARAAESATPDVYDRLYAAERPELFFKATASRSASPSATSRARRSSRASSSRMWRRVAPPRRVASSAAI